MRRMLPLNSSDFTKDFKRNTISTAKTLGYQKIYRLKTVLRIVDDYRSIEEELVMDDFVKFFADIISCVDRKNKFLFDLFVSKLEINRSLLGHRFFMELFISDFNLKSDNNIYLSNRISEAFTRLCSTSLSYNLIYLEEFNAAMDGYYDSLVHVMTETDMFSIFSPNEVYSIDNETCVSICVNVMKLLSRNKQQLGEPYGASLRRFVKIKDLTDRSLFRNSFVDSIEDHIDCIIDMYIMSIKDEVKKVDIMNISKRVKSTVSTIVEYDIDGESTRTLSRMVEESIGTVSDYIQSSVFNIEQLDENILEDIDPILVEVENILFNVVATSVTCSYLSMSLCRKFVNKKDAIREFKRLLIASSYLTTLLGRDRNNDLYPTLENKLL